jgi:hypothetical protein
MAALEEPVPPVHLGFVQADLPEHRDPFLYTYVVLHMSILFTFFALVQSGYNHDRSDAKV